MKDKFGREVAKEKEKEQFKELRDQQRRQADDQREGQEIKGVSRFAFVCIFFGCVG